MRNISGFRVAAHQHSYSLWGYAFLGYQGFQKTNGVGFWGHGLHVLTPSDRGESQSYVALRWPIGRHFLLG